MKTQFVVDSECGIRITEEELKNVYREVMENVRRSEINKLRNDAKLRACEVVKSYDEFKDIVDAAHMQPISRKDKMNAKTKNRLWNSAVSETAHKYAGQSDTETSDSD